MIGPESKAANALFTTASGRALWVGGRVAPSGHTVQFTPNKMNKLVHAALGGVDAITVGPADRVGNEALTKVVTILHAGGGLSFRCYAAVAFAETIRQATVAAQA